MAGYCENGYRLWNPSKRKIEFARNVIFDENGTTHLTTLNQSAKPEFVHIPVLKNGSKSESSDESVAERMRALLGSPQ